MQCACNDDAATAIYWFPPNGDFYDRYSLLYGGETLGWLLCLLRRKATATASRLALDLLLALQYNSSSGLILQVPLRQTTNRTGRPRKYCTVLYIGSNHKI